MFGQIRFLFHRKVEFYPVFLQREPQLKGAVIEPQNCIRSFVAKELGQGSPVTQKVHAMWLIRNQKGQNLIEYAIIVAVVASAMLAMSIYVSRSVQATQQAIQDGYKD